MKTRIFSILILICSGSPLLAQESSEKEIQAVIDLLFDGMRQGDSSKVRQAFHHKAGMRTSFVSTKTGLPVMYSEPVHGFIEAVGSPHEETWDERTANYVYHIDENLAQVWMEYSFYLNDHLSHCGVNSIQLIRLEEGWKITDIADTRRRENCPEISTE